MPMDKLPNAVLEAKEAGHSQGQCHHMIAAPDFGAPMFHLDDARKTIAYVLRYEIDSSDFPVPVVRRGRGKRLHNLAPTARKRSERISQSDIILVRKQRFRRLWITAENRCDGCMAAFNGAVEVVCCHFTSPMLDCSLAAFVILSGVAGSPRNVEPACSSIRSLDRRWALAHRAWWTCARGRLLDLAGRDAMVASEGSIEIRKVAKTHGECDRADVPIGKPWIAQHAVRARETLAQHKR